MRDCRNELLNSLFSAEYNLIEKGQVFWGSAILKRREIVFLGTRGQIEIGVDEALHLSRAALDAIAADEGKAPRDILLIVDNAGQRLAKRDELLGNAGYLAHLSKVLHLARKNGHRVLGLIHSLALSGGFMATGMAATSCIALKSAEIRVMRLDAMARITRIPLSQLEELVRHSAVFGPGVQNYHAIGAIEEIWDVPTPKDLDRAFQDIPNEIQDLRSVAGAERGGRTMAMAVAEMIRQA